MREFLGEVLLSKKGVVQATPVLLRFCIDFVH